MNTKTKTLLAVIIILLLGALVFAFLIYPTYSDIINNSKELVLEKQKMKALETKLDNIQSFKKSYEQIEKDLAKANSFFAKAEAPVNFITFLETIAEDSQVSIQIVPSAPVDDDTMGWQYINFKIVSASTLSNFLKFLDKLESGSYLIKIEGLQISRLNEDNLKSEKYEELSVGDASASITLLVYAN